MAIISFHTVLIYLTTILCLSTASPTKKKDHIKLPSFVKVCHRNDPELNTCAKNSLNSLREHLSIGIPELYIPPIEPLVIPEIKLDQDSGAIYLHSTYNNISISGLSNFTVKEINIEPSKLKFVITMYFPNVSMNAHYQMKGKIMMMPLAGEGGCRANFSNVELTTLILGQRVKKAGDNYIKVKTIKMKYALGKANVHFENLFNGDKALGDRMNLFLNENWESLSEEFKPMMEKAMSEVVRASTSQMFETYRYEDLLPE